MEKNAKSFRVRRTNAELDKSIDDAVIKLIAENGFQSITLLNVSKLAKVEMSVLVKRFDNLEGLLKSYAARYDYWFSTLVEIDRAKTPKENIKHMFIALINELYQNEFMQKFLLWELNDDNLITRRLATAREAYSIGLIDYYRKVFPKASMEIQSLMALVISGIYYLILHRKISTFALIDFDTPQGRDQLIDAVSKMVDEMLPGK